MAEGLGTALQNTIRIPVKTNLNPLKRANDLVKTLNKSTESLNRSLNPLSEQLDRVSRGASAMGRNYKREIDQVKQANQMVQRSNSDTGSSFSKVKEQAIRATESEKNSLQSLRAELDRNARSLSLSQREHQSYVNRLKAEGRTADALKEQNRGLKTSYSSLSTQLTKESEYLRKVAVSSGTASDAYKRQSIKVNDLKSNIARTKGSMDAMRRSSDRTTGSFSKLRGAGSSLVNMGSMVSMAMLPVAAAFKKSADEATNLQNKYTTIRNLLRTGGETSADAKKETAAMQRENNQFALQYGVSPVDMSKGGEELIRRGYSGKQELASHKYFLQAARASGDDYNSVVGYGAPVLEQFGLKNKAGDSRSRMARYTKDVLNKMAYGADLSATNFTGIGNAMRYAGATAHSLHQSLSGTLAGIGVLSNNGQDGSVAGTGLRKVLNSFGSPTMTAKSQQGQIMSMLHLDPEDFRNADGKAKTLAKDFDVLNKATRGYSDSKKFDIYHRFFGTTGQESALILSNNLKQLRGLTDQVGKATKKNYIQDLAHKNMKSWKNQIDVFKQYLNVMGLGFTKTVLPGFTKALSLANHLLKTLIDLPKPVKDLVGYGTAFVSVLASVKLAGLAARKALSWLGGGKANALGALTSFGGGKTKLAGGVIRGVEKAGTVSTVGKLTRSKLLGSGLKATSKELPEIGSRMASRGVLSKTLTGAKAIGSKIPWLDTAIAATSLIGMNKHNAGSKIGNFGGTLAGMEGGAALGSFLGPVGTFVGGGLGAAAGSWLGSKTGKRIQDSFSNKSNRASAPSKPTHRAYNPLNSLPKDAQITTKKALGYVEQANKGWIKTSYDTWSKSKHLSADYQKQGLVYDKLRKGLDGFVNKQQSSSNKSIGYLQKIGAIHAATAQKSYSEEARWGNSRKQVLNRDLQAIKVDEQKGGNNRANLVAKLNSDIVKITSKGSNKQRQIYQRLQNSTSNLSYGQYRSVLKYSGRAERATITSAKKSYNGQVSTAEATYRHTLKAAKQVYGVHSSEYQSVKKFAQRQYDKTTTAAEKQYEKTKYWAEQQRKKVVKQAKLQATEVANSLLTATGKLGGQLGRILSENALAGIVTQPTKQKKNGLTNTIARNNRGNQNAKTANEATLPGLPTYSPGALTNRRRLTAADRKVQRRANSVGIQTLPGHAHGGAISRTQLAMVGEQGLPELAYNPKTGKYRLLGANGPAVTRVYANEHILNGRDTNKALSGGIGAGRALKGYAKGTDKLKAGKRVTAAISVDDRGLKGISRDYDKTTKKSAASIEKLGKNSNKTWKNISKDTKKSSSSIQKNTVSDYDDMQKHSTLQVSQLYSGSIKRFKAIMNDTKKNTQKVQTNTVGDFDDMQKGSMVQMSQLHKGMNSEAKSTVSDFASIFGKLDNYAHSAMANAIKQLNKGFSSINSVFGQFGGNKNVLHLAHYAKGTQNGPIKRHMLGVVNDAKSGPRQELIAKQDGRLLAPRGHDVVTPLEPGDEIFNGHEVESARRYGLLPHFAKGTGKKSNSLLKSLINRSDKHPSKAFADNFVVKVAPNGSTLQKGVTNTERSAATKPGNPWSKAAWGALADAASGGGSGVGGSWRHTPGLKETDPFGASRANMYGPGAKHDGVDFSGALGAAIRAIHGGKVIKTGGTGISDLGKVIIVKSDDGFQEIYQEFGGMKNIKVGVGDTIRTGQKIATLGSLLGAGSGSHVHIGVTKGNPLHKNMLSTSGWYDVTKMHGSSNGTPKKAKKQSALTKLVNKQLASQIKWVEKHLAPKDDIGSLGGFGLSGGLGKRAKTLAAAFKKLYPAATTAGIAAVLGNWNFESGGLNPGAVNSGGGASGLGQWLGGRKTNLINFAHRHGMNWKSAAAQLEFAVKGEGSDSSILRRILRGHGSVSSLAAEFSKEWERGGHTSEHVNGAKQVSRALKGFANGGWSNKPAIFGEAKGQPEVAINPKRDSADRLIGEAITARAKVSKESPFRRWLDSRKAAKERQSLRRDIHSASNQKQKPAMAMPKIEIHNEFNITGDVSNKQADAVSSKIQKAINKAVNEYMQNTYNKLGYGD